VSASEERDMRASGRVLRTWSLIKSVPLRSILRLQAPLLQLLSTRPDLSEDQLVVLGLKHLYSNPDKPKDGRHLTLTDLDVAATSEAPSKATPVQRRYRKQAAYIVTAVREQVQLSIKRAGIDEAIEIAEGYRERGATIVSIRAPDGMTYSLDDFDALRRNIR
jgi:hypothetical protein